MCKRFCLLGDSFISKVKYSFLTAYGRSSCFEFLFCFSSTILLLKWNPYFLTCENMPNYSCQFWKRKSVFLQVLSQFSVPSNITLLFCFSSNIIYFVQKEPIKVQIFETFECSVQNLSNCSGQFWSDKSIPFQILHRSSLSWIMTYL